MSVLAFLLAFELPSARREYKGPLRDEFFTKTGTASAPPLIHKASNNETQYSFAALELQELRTFTLIGKAPA
ncbi:hypothetical protein FXO38_03318 [Capsicum annuum]|nr:hypothetical protein FXO38_03318 [Capsicum annuum]